MAPPGPIPSHYAVIVVPTTFWLAIMMGGWPFTGELEPDRLWSAHAGRGVRRDVRGVPGLLQLRLPAGRAGVLQSAPKGMFNGVSALVFYVTALAVMFLVLCFDLWPLTLFPGS